MITINLDMYFLIISFKNNFILLELMLKTASFLINFGVIHNWFYHTHSFNKKKLHKHIIIIYRLNNAFVLKTLIVSDKQQYVFLTLYSKFL